MAKLMKMFLVVSLLLSVAALADASSKEPEQPGQMPATPPVLSNRPPDPFYGYPPGFPPGYAPGYPPYGFPAYYSRPEMFYSPPPFPGYPSPLPRPAVPERKLTDVETSVPVKEETVDPTAPKEVKETSIPETSITSLDKGPRSLELVKSAPSKGHVPKIRELRQLTSQQRMVAKIVRPFVQYLHTHRKQTLQQLHVEFRTHFPKETPYFEENFWPIVKTNFRPEAANHLRMDRIETQMASQIFKIDFNSLPHGLRNKMAPPNSHPKLFSSSKLSQVLATLAKEREGSRDGSDSLSGLQLRPDFAQKYKLLQALYRAENAMFENRSSPEQVLVSLRSFNIRSIKSFKSNSRHTIEYFSTTIRQFRLHKKTILNTDFKQLMKSVHFMVKTLRNKLLGRFFVRFIALYADLRIRNNNPTHRQRQTLNLAIENLIAELGAGEYLATIFRIIKQVPFFAKMQRLPANQPPQAFSIFRQTVDNQLRSGSLRFLLSHFFQGIADKIAVIESLVLMEEPRLMNTLRFDFRSLLIDFSTRFRLNSSRQFNQALGTVSSQVDSVLRRAPSTPTRSYFAQFISVYAKIAFQIFGRYFFLVKQPEVFSGFAQQHDIPRQFFPWNYQALVHRIHDPHLLGSAITVKTRENSQQTDEAVNKIIHSLSQYINNPNGVIFSSGAERQQVLDVIDGLLRKQNSNVLSHKSIMIVNQLRTNILSQQQEKTISVQKSIPVSLPIPTVNIDREITRFKFLLHRVHPLPATGPQDFKISIRSLEDSAVLTKFLITLFQISTPEENGILITITDTFLEAHVMSDDIRIQMDTFYSAARLYTDHYEALFALNDAPKARLLWKALMRFYSRECHIELYKQLTLRLLFLTSDPQFQEGRFNRVKKVLINLFLFLSKNQQFDLQKDCQTASLMITRRKFLTDSVIRRSFLLSSFRKIFFRLSHPPTQPRGRKPSLSSFAMLQRMHGGHTVINKQSHDFAAEALPGLVGGGKRIGDDPTEPPEEDPSDKQIILLLKLYLELYGSKVPFPPGFRWSGILLRLSPDERMFLINLLKKYDGDYHGISSERDLNIIMRIRQILFKINISKSPPNTQSDHQSLTFATSMVDSFYRQFAKHHRISVSSKRLRFKVSPALFSYFVDLRQKHPEESASQIVKHNPRVYKHIKKSLFFLYNPKTPPIGREPPEQSPPDRGFARFSRSYLLRYFEQSLHAFRDNPQFLAKKLFRNNSKELREYLRLVFKKGCPEEKPDPNITKILRRQKLRFYNRLIRGFYSKTKFLDDSKDTKRFNARMFFKYLPFGQRQFVQRTFNRFEGPVRFFREGPVTKMGGLLHRVQFKYKAKCKSTACKSTCYRIVDGEQIEITDEEKEQLGFKFDCSAASNALRLFDLNGNIVDSSESAGYGCGCQCGSNTGGVQINEKPTFNFNVNFENEKEASEFEDFIKNSDFVSKIKDSNIIDLEKLKIKYGVSDIQRRYDLQLLHKTPLAAPSDLHGLKTDQYGNDISSFVGFGTPENVGMFPIDKNLHKILPGQKYTVSGEGQAGSNQDSVTTPQFWISEVGRVENQEPTQDDDENLVDNLLTSNSEIEPGNGDFASWKQHQLFKIIGGRVETNRKLKRKEVRNEFGGGTQENLDPFLNQSNGSDTGSRMDFDQGTKMRNSEWLRMI